MIVGIRNEKEDIDTIATAVVMGLFIDGCEYGAIGIDPKRPFGNSDVNGDMLEMIGAEQEGDDGEGPCWSSDQLDYVRIIYHEKVIPRIQAVWKARL
jgi:hypothetical protein